MAEGGEVTPTGSTQNQTIELISELSEPLQGLQSSMTPGASNAATEKTANNQSRFGIFRVLAGITPGTSCTTQNTQLHVDTSATDTRLHNSSAMLYTGSNYMPCAGSSTSGIATRTGSAPLDTVLFPGYGHTQISCDPRLNMAALSDGTGFSCDPRSNMASATESARISCDPRFNMAAPSGNNVVPLLLQQLKENKEMFSQQQAALDKLTATVDSIINRSGSLNPNVSSVDSGDLESQYDFVSSGDESDADQEPVPKKQKTDPELNPKSKSKLNKLRAVESQFQKQETLGPVVHEVVASAVNKGLSEAVDHKAASVQDLLTKYSRPENCAYLDVPKVNKLLWSNRNTAREIKQTDKAFQRTQTYVTKGMTPIIQMMNKTLLMESEEAEELFDLSLDAFNLLAYAHRDISTHRRKLLLPAISTRYTALCNESENFTSPTHLFGEDKDLEKRMKEIEETQKLGKTLTIVSSNRPRQHAKPESRWAPKYPVTNRQTSSRDFLGKRALPHRPAHQQQKMGMKKRNQSPKTSQSYHRQ